VVHPRLDLIVLPGSRQIHTLITRTGVLQELTRAGARVLEPVCGPCIGMGMAPPSEAVSLRTFNRNFAGRSGTPSANVYLCSPEIAAAAAVHGEIVDPRRLGEPPLDHDPVRLSGQR
jgi:aconitate hydratase